VSSVVSSVASSVVSGVVTGVVASVVTGIVPPRRFQLSGIGFDLRDACDFDLRAPDQAPLRPPFPSRVNAGGGSSYQRQHKASCVSQGRLSARSINERVVTRTAAAQCREWIARLLIQRLALSSHTAVRAAVGLCPTSTPRLGLVRGG